MRVPSSVVAVLVIAACGGSGSQPSPDGGGPDASGLQIAPAAYVVPIGRSQIFVAPGATSWSVVEGDAGGSVTGTGTYTAPQVPGTYHITASAGGAAATATVTVADFTLSTLAGSIGGRGHIDGPRPTNRLDGPDGIVGDGAGMFYVADSGSFTIRKFDSTTGMVTTLAGTAYSGGDVDGIGVAASFGDVGALAIDAAHTTLYMVEQNAHTVRAITIATGVVTTLAGQESQSGATNGVGTTARFNYPSGIALVGTNTLVIADSGNCVLRAIALDTRTVSTLAGTVGTCTSTDGAMPTFANPYALAVVGSAIIVGEQAAIRIYASSGATTIAGGTTAGYVDGNGLAARFTDVVGIVADGAGTLYVADRANQVIRSVGLGAPHVVKTVAGSFAMRGSQDGTGAAARFTYPSQVTFANGSAWVTDSATVRSLSTTNVVATVAGLGAHAGTTNGTFAATLLDLPYGLIVGDAQTIYVTESYDVRALAMASQQVVTPAGGATSGTADGTGAAARFATIGGGALDAASHTLYVTDLENHAIRRIDLPTGAVTTPYSDLAAPTRIGYVDGTGTASRFHTPTDLVKVGGVLYVCDPGNHAVRAIDLATGVTTTFAGGTDGTADGAGSAAQFRAPSAIATDGANLYVSDDAYNTSQAHTIRRIEIATATVSTIAGQAGNWGHDDGIGTAATVGDVLALAWDGADTLYFTDVTEQLLRRIYLPTGAVSTVAGLPGRGLQLGSVTAARLGTPIGLAMPAPGRFLIVTHDENAVLQLVQQ